MDLGLRQVSRKILQNLPPCVAVITFSRVCEMHAMLEWQLRIGVAQQMGRISLSETQNCGSESFSTTAK